MRPPMLPVWAPGCGVAALAPLAAGELDAVGVDGEHAAVSPITTAANRVVARIRPAQGGAEVSVVAVVAPPISRPPATRTRPSDRSAAVWKPLASCIVAAGHHFLPTGS